MKKLILFLLFISTYSIAQTIDVTKIVQKEEFGLMFKLENERHPDGHISLDCQSFLQKIDFFDSSGNLYSENYIDINECEYLFRQTQKCIETQAVKCFDPDYIFNNSCECSVD